MFKTSFQYLIQVLVIHVTFNTYGNFVSFFKDTEIFQAAETETQTTSVNREVLEKQVMHSNEKFCQLVSSLLKNVFFKSFILIAFFFQFKLSSFLQFTCQSESVINPRKVTLPWL